VGPIVSKMVSIYAPDFVKQWLADKTLIYVTTLIRYFKNLDWIRMC
jgi:hypothetical protein